MKKQKEISINFNNIELFYLQDAISKMYWQLKEKRRR